MDYRYKYEKYKKKYSQLKGCKDKFEPIDFSTLPTNYPYRETAKPNNIHIGQRKLLLNEIYFLTRFGHLSDTVIYAGAAPGNHIPIVADLFPNHKFILYDPSPFQIKESNNVAIYTGTLNGYFTDTVAQKYKDKNVLFISDIRSVKDITDFNEFEERVILDNELQRDWVTIMKPIKASLKFRIPFTIKDKYEYLDGLVELQAWAPRSSSETRLIVDLIYKMKIYDPISYENKMFYFNNYIRPYKRYQGESWDLSYEIFIWQQYFKGDNDKVNEMMQQVSKVLKRDVSGAYL
jgi:cap2 methyltransferase